MLKFFGSVNDLQNIFFPVDGSWEEINGKHVFRSEDGGVVNFWPRTKTIQFQGRALPLRRLQKLFEVENEKFELIIEGVY